MTSREQFEEWCDRTGQFETLYGGQKPKRVYDENLWKVWEASREAMPCEAPWPEYS
jgi:hypothetical protein